MNGARSAAAAVLAVPIVLVLIVVLVAAAAVSGLTTLIGQAGAPSPVAGVDIPLDYLVLYQQAANDCPGLDWAVLAAIGKVETNHGRSTLPGVHTGQNAAGAGGPMQMLQPTFDTVLVRHRLPVGGASPPSRYNPHDAIHAAAYNLCDHGAAHNLPAAVFAYNHSDTYVGNVLTQAATYRQNPQIRTVWPSEQATIPDPSGTGGHVTARTNALYRTLTAGGHIREGASCWDPHLNNPESDHPRGKACDLFFNPHDPADITRGWQLATQLAALQATDGVHYLIWQGRIWSAESPSWSVYHSTIYDCPNPANITGCHYDHIHVSLF